MSLYDRNFNELNDFEKEFLEKGSKDIGKAHALKDIPLVPKGIKHYKSLFPNNFLDPDDTADPILSKFISKLDESHTTERTILNFIKENKGYFLIGSLMNSYRIGSQNAFIFPEFRLGNSYQVDYLLVGKTREVMSLFLWNWKTLIKRLHFKTEIMEMQLEKVLIK